MRAWYKMKMVWVSTALAIACGYYLNHWIDAQVTIHYMQEEQVSLTRRGELMTQLLSQTGGDLSHRAKLERVAKSLNPADHVVKSEGDTLAIDALIFKFKGGNFVKLEYME